MSTNTQNDSFDHSSEGMRRIAIRQSTTRKIENMRQLLGELAWRDLDVPATALLLRISCSSARSYLYELRDAGIIAVRIGEVAGRTENTAFHVCSDEAHIQDFLAQVGTSKVSQARTTHGQKSKSTIVSSGRSLHIMADDVKFPLSVSKTTPQRDPLVAALFGTAIQPGKAAA